jgi:hypothetical protein
MVIRNEETGLTLPPAPEFGLDGAWPPVETEWVPIRWQLFSAVPSYHFDRCADIAYAIATRFGSGEDGGGPLYTENALNDDFLYRSVFAEIDEVVGEDKPKQWTWLHIKSAKIGDTDFRTSHIELRRMVHSVRWRRNNSVTKLPPSTVHEMTHDITTGLSIEHSQTLANSFGLSLGGKVAVAPAQLSSRLQQEFGLRLGITSQERRSTKLTLSNPSNDRYRLFALWHVDHRITVDNLYVGLYTKDFQGPKAGFFDNVRPSWDQLADIEYVADSDPHITYAEGSLTA